MEKYSLYVPKLVTREENFAPGHTGPFTVESLSPHLVIATEDVRTATEIEAQKEAGVGQFETMILDNLKKAGVQNTIKNERLNFDRLEPYAGEWLHAEGEYNGKRRRHTSGSHLYRP